MALPRWTWRRALVELAGACLVAYLTRHQAAPVVLFGFWAAFFSVISGIWSAFRTGADVVASAVITALKWLKGRVFDLGRALGSAIAHVGRGLVDVGDWVITGIRDGLIPAIQAVYHTIRDGFSIFARAVGRVIDWVKRARSFVVALYNSYIRPIVDVIDRVRQALHILAGLGLDAAANVERKLLDLENRIQAPFLELVHKLNDVINVLNRVVTLNGTIQRLTLFRSLFDYRHSFVNFTIRQIATPKGDLIPPVKPVIKDLDPVRQAEATSTIVRLAAAGVRGATVDDLAWVQDVIDRLEQVGTQ